MKLDEYRTLAMGCAEAYADLGRATRGYVRGKLLHDPLYRQLADLGPFLEPVCDLGCGRGQTSLLFAALQPGIRMRGVDWDGKKVELARSAARAAGHKHLSFGRADLRMFDPPSAGTVLLLDVLHYSPRDIQDEILERAACALEPGGRLLVRDVDASGTWRSRANIWQERLGNLVGLNRGATLDFRSADSLEGHLASLGLEVRRFESWQGTPLSNVLFEARAREE